MYIKIYSLLSMNVFMDESTQFLVRAIQEIIDLLERYEASRNIDLGVALSCSSESGLSSQGFVIEMIGSTFRTLSTASTPVKPSSSSIV